MRSYKDCLVEYIEELGYTELNSSWYNYFQNRIKGSNNFQLIESTPPISSINDLKYYADLVPSTKLIQRYQLFSPKKISQCYKSLVESLMISEIERVKQISRNRDFNWEVCADTLNFYKKSNRKTFKESIKECLLKSKIDIKTINDNEAYSNKYVEAIDAFFEEDNYFLDQPDYNVIDNGLSEDVEVNFETEANKNSSQERWSDTVLANKMQFFHSTSADLLEQNSLAQVSGIKITGKLNDLKSYTVEKGDWFNQEISLQLHGSSSFDLQERINYQTRKNLAKNLERHYTQFYTITGFDLTIEIENSYDEDQIEQLRNERYSIFPFHFSEKFEHYKWIDTNKYGDLRIRIKSIAPQKTVIGGELKIIKERHL